MFNLGIYVTVYTKTKILECMCATITNDDDDDVDDGGDDDVRVVCTKM